MTLSRWLRDYLYIPLGGNRKGRDPHVPQPDADDAARRPVARRGVDVRRLGWDPRRSGCAIERATGWRPHDALSGTLVRAACSRSTSSASRGSSSAPIRSRTRVEVIDAALHGVGAALAARHDVGRARDRRRDRWVSTSGRRRVSGLLDVFGRLPARRAGRVRRGRAHCHQHARPDGVAPFIYFRF